MFLVGLTGGILGCPVIDADVVARKVVEPQSPAYRLIVQHFGQEILLDNGEIDRQKLRQIIFSSPKKRRLLNSITHPEIHKEMFKQILLYFIKGYRYVVLDVPLLFETRRLTRFLTHTVVVYWYDVHFLFLCSGPCVDLVFKADVKITLKAGSFSVMLELFIYIIVFINIFIYIFSVVEPQSPAYRLIVQHFGQEILLDNGEIDRQKLRQIIFSSPKKRRLLNSITHPEIHKEMFKQILLYFIKGTLTNA
uniref:Dephospho-CoA kinase domain containing n=1 Tax=Sinocyclocheilus rhinocerous TaxID=307959 RepID=A0A673FFB5_9TELE